MNQGDIWAFAIGSKTTIGRYLGVHVLTGGGWLNVRQTSVCREQAVGCGYDDVDLDEYLQVRRRAEMRPRTWESTVATLRCHTQIQLILAGLCGA